MKKYLFMMMSAMLITLVGMTSCSSEDVDNTDLEDVDNTDLETIKELKTHIVGSWQLVRNDLNQDLSSQNLIFTFHENGEVSVPDSIQNHWSENKEIITHMTFDVVKTDLMDLPYHVLLISVNDVEYQFDYIFPTDYNEMKWLGLGVLKDGVYIAYQHDLFIFRKCN